MHGRLYNEWARLGTWVRLQPIDDVKDYLGAKYAIYFAWLGFYTQLLIPASFFGIAVLLYGYFTSSTDYVRYFIFKNYTYISFFYCAFMFAFYMNELFKWTKVYVYFSYEISLVVY